MVKRVIIIIVTLLVAGYIVLAVTKFNRPSGKETCKDIEVVIKDTAFAGFVTKDKISNVLKNKGVYPVGKKMDAIKTKTIERTLKKQPLIDDVECFKTPGGTIRIEISQRIPVLHILSVTGEDYYVDDKGSIIPQSAKCVAHRAIVTGYVEKSFISRYLYKFGVYLQNDPFWNAQIEQINVTPKGDIELVPRVGEQIIYLGRLNNFEEKLKRLRTFYESALNKVGWNKHTRINLEFSNQIICSKRDTANCNK